MKIFITGASGFIGSAVVRELLSAGHQVIGLARSDESAAAITNAGAMPLRGSLEDLDSLKKGARESDGVINLGFNHDFSQFETSVQVEFHAIEAMGDVLKGTGRPFVLASGGPTVTETFDVNDRPMPRISAAAKVLALANDDVRSSIIRLAPCVHDAAKCGFIGGLAAIAKRTGVSGYVKDGTNRWSAVHRLDAAHLFCLALETAPAGSVLQAVADEGIPLKTIAEIIGRHLHLPVRSIADHDVAAHFGWLSRVIGAELPAVSTQTRLRFDWQPMHPGLLDDLEHGYFIDGL